MHAGSLASLRKACRLQTAYYRISSVWATPARYRNGLGVTDV